MINKLSDAVMKKLASSDSSKTLTPDHMNHIKLCLSGLYPVFCAPDHPTYAVMIQEALRELNQVGGSTQKAISKFIREWFDCLPLAYESLLSHHLKKLSESGEIVRTSKNCYMLPAEKNDSVSLRDQVQKQKRSELGRGRRTGIRIEHKSLAEEQVEVTEQEREHGKQSQESYQAEQYSKLIDDQNGCPEQQMEQQEEVHGQRQMQEVAMIPKEQQDEGHGQKSKSQMQEVAVIVEKQNNPKQIYKATEEHAEETEQQREHGQQIQEPNQEQYTKVIDNESACPEQTEQQDEVSGQQSQTKIQEVAMIVEKQNNAKRKYKVTEEQVEVNEQRLHGQQSQERSVQEQHGKVIDDQIESSVELRYEVNGEQSKNQMEEVAVIVEKQNSSIRKYRADDEQVEESEQKREQPRKHIQEPSIEEQHNMVIDGQNRSPDEQNDDVDGQNSKPQMQEIIVIVEKQSVAEHKYKVTEEQQFQVTEQQREHGQQSQSHEPSQEERHIKVVDYQNRSPEHQNEQPDEADGQSRQEIAVIFKETINAEQSYKATEENIRAREDEHIEEQCQTKDQSCEVSREQLQIEGFEREIMLIEELVDIHEKLTKPEQKIEMIPERNKTQEQIKFISNIVDSRSMQDLSSKKQEKDADIAINSSPSLTSQKMSHHGSPLLSEENYVELLTRTRKLEEKLLQNLSSIREGSNNSIQKPIEDLEQKPLPITSPCGEREYIVCGFPEEEKHKPESSAQRKAFESQGVEMSASLELPMELLLKDGKLANRGSRQQMPKCQNKSIKTFPDVELPSQQEIGDLERSLELVTMEIENSREASRIVGKRTCLNFDAKHEKEKHLEVQNSHTGELSLLVASCHSPEHEVESKLKNQQLKLKKPERPQHVKLLSVERGHKAYEVESNITNSSVDLLQASKEPDSELKIQEKSQELNQSLQSVGQEKQPQAVLFGVVKAPDGQVVTDEEQQEEDVIRETAVEIELTESEQLCQKQQEKQEQCQKLRPRRKRPSESDSGVQKAPKSQQQENEVEERPIELGTGILDQSCQTQPQTLGQQQQRQLQRRSRKSDCRNQKDGEERQAEKVTEQSCQTQHETLEQQKLRWLGPQDQRPSNSDQQVEKAPACQELEHEQDPRKQIQELGMKLDHLEVKMSVQAQKKAQEPSQRRQLLPQGQRQSKSEVSITTSVVESPSTRHQDTLIPNLQEAEKPQELKTSATKTGQTQHQRQLRPRVKKLSESGQAQTGSREVLSPSQSLCEEYSSLSNSGRSQMQNPGVEDVCQEKNQHENHCNQRKRCTPEPTMDALGSISPCQKLELGQNIELLNPEAFHNVGPTVVDDLSQPFEEKINHQGQQKKLKCKPTATTKIPDELVLTVQQLVAEAQIAVPPPELKPTIKELQRLHHMKLRSHRQSVSQSGPAVSMTESSPSQHQCEQPQEKEHHVPTTAKVPDELVLPSQLLVAESQIAVTPPELKPTIKELQRLRHMKLRSHSQGVSQSDPAVFMTESSSSQHQCEQLQEKEQNDELQHQKRQKQKPPRPKENVDPTIGVLFPSAEQQPQKRRRGRPHKEKLATAATSDESLPDKCQKQLEQPEKQRRERRCKEKLATVRTSDISLPDKTQKQLEQPEKRKLGRPRKLVAKIILSRINLSSKNKPQGQKRGRGRPRKVKEET